MPQRISSLIILMAAGLILSGCATKSEQTAQPAETNADDFVTQTYQQGRQALEQRNLKVAYHSFAELSDYCAKTFAEEGVTYRTARTIKEQMDEFLRAKRGIGYSLIEMNNLSEAEQIYLEVLEINPDDEAAQNELEYIRQLRAS
ncbi:hypothetical protein [Pseudidiomarina taiwanensis]|uniref:Uncharacterized protein n=1 Tax=Pseudidiomarina taiwanensis TaxID=337250 RepID=A0A432ZEG9_9GAMM|nr:hypothetical protein [Pseudidiomarina taiwanensis]RUO76348.1 hypothetical protein CWI83_08265 [Pseudidiomarina taiwanensis]